MLSTEVRYVDWASSSIETEGDCEGELELVCLPRETSDPVGMHQEAKRRTRGLQDLRLWLVVRPVEILSALDGGRWRSGQTREPRMRRS